MFTEKSHRENSMKAIHFSFGRKPYVMLRQVSASLLIATVFLSGCGNTALPSPNAAIVPTTSAQAIKHVVVIFGENISFDHYFGTYPNTANLPGETKFTAATGTATPNGLTAGLLSANPNLNGANGDGASNPFLLP